MPIQLLKSSFVHYNFPKSPNRRDAKPISSIDNRAESEQHAIDSVRFGGWQTQTASICQIDAKENEDRTGRIDAISVSVEFRRAACISAVDPDFHELKEFVLTEAQVVQKQTVYDKEREIRNGEYRRMRTRLNFQSPPLRPCQQQCQRLQQPHRLPIRFQSLRNSLRNSPFLYKRR
jgi:hypothetical protein